METRNPLLPYCPETRNRIRASVAAYAYEIANNPIISDADFDRICRAIRPMMTTGAPIFDWFFLTVFDPSTGVWIHKHPDIPGLARVYSQLSRTVRGISQSVSPSLPGGIARTCTVHLPGANAPPLKATRTDS